jgi:hypothetical protein
MNFPYGSYCEQDPRAHNPNKAMALYRKAYNNACISTVTLYSNTPYNDFLFEFRRRGDGDFSWLSNNCATVIENLLEFLFPDKTNHVRSYLLYSLNFIPFIPVTLFSAFTDTLLHGIGVSTPAMVFERAKCLEEKYGRKSLYRFQYNALFQIPLQIRNRPHRDQSENKLDESLMLNVYRRLKMI